MATTGGEGGGAAFFIGDGLLAQKGGDGLEKGAEIDVLARGDAAENAAAAVVGVVGVVLLGTALGDAFKAGSVVEAVAGVDGEHGGGEVGVELAEDGLAETYGATRHDACDGAADGVALGLYLADKSLHLGSAGGVGAAHGVGVGEGEVQFGVGNVNGDVAHLRGVGLDIYAVLTEHEHGEGAGHDAGDGLAGRGTAAAAEVADAVFLLIGEVGVGGAEDVAQFLVVGGTLVGVAHDEADGRTGGLALEYAADDFQRVVFLAAGGEGALSRAAAVELLLNEAQVHLYAGGHAVYHAPDGGTVAFTEGGETEDLAEGVHLGE